MRRSFLARRALLILCVIFFLVPFALRGARYSLQRMENNVKDWLPSDFEETKVLKWCADHFISDQGFVVLTWDGCSKDEESFQLFVDKLRTELVPEPGQLEQPIDLATMSEPELQEYERQAEIERAREVGDQLGLFVTQDFPQDWGGLNEKWLMGVNGDKFFVTPNGELYRWLGKPDFMPAIWRFGARLVNGKFVESEFIAQFGEQSSEDQTNPFHDNPRLLTARVLRSMTTGPEALAALTDSVRSGMVGKGDSEQAKRNAAEEIALNRLKGTLFGKDGKQTCVMITLSDVARVDQRLVIGRGLLGKPRGKLIDMAVESGVLPPPMPPLHPFASEVPINGRVLRMGGPPVDNVAIDEEGQITLVRLVGFSIILGVLLAYICFRSVVVTIMVFVTGGVSAIASLGIVYWSGASVDAILMSMPSLVYVLGLSGAVHIVNYYRDAAQEHGLVGAPERAIRHGWGPCTLAAFTTALGLISLCMSSLIPIQKFGLYSALGVMATLIMMFTFLPAALQLWPPGYDRQTKGDSKASVGKVQLLVGRFWDRVGAWIIERYRFVTICCFAVFIGFGLGLFKIETSVKLLKLFDPAAKIIRDYAWLEHNVGKLVPMELVTHIKPELQVAPTKRQLTSQEAHDVKFQLNFLERMEVVNAIQLSIEDALGEKGTDVVGRALSAPRLAPKLPSPSSTTTRRTMNALLLKNRDKLLAEDYLAIDQVDQSELWRVSLRVGALNDVDYGDFVGELKRTVEPVIGAYQARDEILKKIDELNDGKGFGNARICILGVSGRNTQLRQARDPVVNQTTDLPEAARPVTNDVTVSKNQIDQPFYFASTLTRSLRVKGFRNRPKYRQYMAIHDPSKSNLEEYFTAYKKKYKVDQKLTLAKWIAGMDCIVMAGDYKNYDADFIKANATCVLDVAEHWQYDSAANSKTAKERDRPIAVTYTGIVPIVYKAQHTLMTSLQGSISWAFIMIAGVMMILLRNWREPFHWYHNSINVRAGMISMFPNVFPVVLIFGAMGLWGITVDIGTMMTASVAMGVAVDDTIHFLTWFRAGVRRGLPRKESILLAYDRCATAMTQTTLIGGLGLAVFAFGTFTPTQRFGTLMLVLLAAALIGDLIFLPALLASSVGRWFCPRIDAQKEKHGIVSGGAAVAEIPQSGRPATLHSGLKTKSGRSIRSDNPHDGVGH